MSDHLLDRQLPLHPNPRDAVLHNGGQGAEGFRRHPWRDRDHGPGHDWLGLGRIGGLVKVSLQDQQLFIEGGNVLPESVQLILTVLKPLPVSGKPRHPFLDIIHAHRRSALGVHIHPEPRPGSQIGGSTLDAHHLQQAHCHVEAGHAHHRPILPRIVQGHLG